MACLSPSIHCINGSLNHDMKAFLHAARGNIVDKALCYRPKGRGFDNR
jgi:hypothetical protein